MIGFKLATSLILNINIFILSNLYFNFNILINRYCYFLQKFKYIF